MRPTCAKAGQCTFYISSFGPLSLALYIPYPVLDGNKKLVRTQTKKVVKVLNSIWRALLAIYILGEV